jgi:hypothetical protein
MKLVIDPGALGGVQYAARVQEHLAASPENEVIFTDSALQEAFKDASGIGAATARKPTAEGIRACLATPLVKSAYAVRPYRQIR